MADTVRTLDYFNNLSTGVFKDNVAGDISAQDVRDFLVTALEMQSDMGAANPGGRLTLVSGSAVADSAAATTIYYTPHSHGIIPLWDSLGKWLSVSFSEVSLALGTVVSGRPYDVFGYLSSGSLALEKVAWTNDTTRATAVTVQNGRWCKFGSPTHLYLGSFYTTSTTQTLDSENQRFIFNQYNREVRVFNNLNYGNITTIFNTNGYKQFNDDSAAKAEMMAGSSDASFSLMLSCYFKDTDLTSDAQACQFGADFNSISSFSNQINASKGNPQTVHGYIPSAGSGMGILPANRKSDCNMVVRNVGGTADGDSYFSYVAFKGVVVL